MVFCCLSQSGGWIGEIYEEASEQGGGRALATALGGDVIRYFGMEYVVHVQLYSAAAWAGLGEPITFWICFAGIRPRLIDEPKRFFLIADCVWTPPHGTTCRTDGYYIRTQRERERGVCVCALSPAVAQGQLRQDAYTMTKIEYFT